MNPITGSTRPLALARLPCAAPPRPRPARSAPDAPGSAHTSPGSSDESAHALCPPPSSRCAGRFSVRRDLGLEGGDGHDGQEALRDLAGQGSLAQRERGPADQGQGGRDGSAGEGPRLLRHGRGEEPRPGRRRGHQQEGREGERDGHVHGLGRREDADPEVDGPDWHRGGQWGNRLRARQGRPLLEPMRSRARGARSRSRT